MRRWRLTVGGRAVIEALGELRSQYTGGTDPLLIVPPHLPAPPKGRTIVLGAGKASAAIATYRAFGGGPAINWQANSGDKLGSWGTQVDRGMTDIFRLAKSCHADRLQDTTKPGSGRGQPQQ